MAGVDAAAGLVERAAVLFGASQALREAIGSPILGPDLARFQQAVAAVRLALGEEQFTAAERRGRGADRGRARSRWPAATLARRPGMTAAAARLAPA